MNKRHWLWILMSVLVLSAVLFLTACGSTPQATTPGITSPKSPNETIAQSSTTTKPTTAIQPQRGGNITLLTTKKLTAFGPPVEVEADMSPEVIHPVWDTVIAYDKTGMPLPKLTTVDISPDGKTMTFNLRKGVKFHDGTDFNADAIQYHIKKFKFLRSSFDPITSMDILDPNTIRFNLQTPCPNLIQKLGGSLWGGINSPTALQKAPISIDNKDHIAGTGPFKFVNYMRDANIKLTKNTNYWDSGKPYLDAMEYKFYADPTSALMSFQAGEGQILFPIQPKDAVDLKAQGFNIVAGSGTIAVLCPDSKPGSPWSDKRVREALEYAIDKETLCKTIGYGFWTPQYQPSPSSKYSYVPGLLERKYDKAKAKQLLTEAGFPNGFETTIFTVTGSDQTVPTSIQGALAEIGIKAKIDTKTNPAFMEQGSKGWTNGLRYFSPGLDVDPLATYNAFYGRAISHFMAMDKPESMMAAVEKAYQEQSIEKRKTLLQSVAQTLHDGELIVPLWTLPSMAATTKTVNGVDLYAIDIHASDPASWWLSK
jgi:peptide/nickel transport system substrate-binding protein